MILILRHVSIQEPTSVSPFVSLSFADIFRFQMCRCLWTVSEKDWSFIFLYFWSVFTRFSHLLSLTSTCGKQIYWRSINFHILASQSSMTSPVLNISWILLFSNDTKCLNHVVELTWDCSRNELVLPRIIHWVIFDAKQVRSIRIQILIDWVQDETNFVYFYHIFSIS